VASHAVAAPRMLDLYDVGSEVTENLAAQWARQDRRDVENPQIAERRSITRRHR
jgi:hypothetical protein